MFEKLIVQSFSKVRCFERATKAAYTRFIGESLVLNELPEISAYSIEILKK